MAGQLNVVADRLSRRGQVLSKDVFRRLCRLTGQPWIDLFATHLNHKLPTYISPIPDAQALAVDALSYPWEGIWGYAYPPTEIMAKVLTKIRVESCKILLIAPLFPQAMWYKALRDLSVDIPIGLPGIKDLVMQSHTRVLHERPASMRLHAWTLSNSPSERKAFLDKWPSWCRGLLDQGQPDFTRSMESFCYLVRQREGRR